MNERTPDKPEDALIQPFPPHGRTGEWDCQCARCGSSADWRECEECDEDGMSGHDCGEDCCMCLHPDENVLCEFCGGHGGDYWCCSSSEWCQANPLDGREAMTRGRIEWFQVQESDSPE